MRLSILSENKASYKVIISIAGSNHLITVLANSIESDPMNRGEYDNTPAIRLNLPWEVYCDENEHTAICPCDRTTSLYGECLLFPLNEKGMELYKVYEDNQDEFYLNVTPLNPRYPRRVQGLTLDVDSDWIRSIEQV